jgi:hypothetical protein
LASFLSPQAANDTSSGSFCSPETLDDGTVEFSHFVEVNYGAANLVRAHGTFAFYCYSCSYCELVIRRELSCWEAATLLLVRTGSLPLETTVSDIQKASESHINLMHLNADAQSYFGLTG